MTLDSWDMSRANDESGSFVLIDVREEEVDEGGRRQNSGHYRKIAYVRVSHPFREPYIERMPLVDRFDNK